MSTKINPYENREVKTKSDGLNPYEPYLEQKTEKESLVSESQAAPAISRKQQQINDILESEQMERDIERGQAQTMSRIGETILGLPGDIQNIGEHISGRKLQEGAVRLPTSQKLQEVSEKVTGGYTKPKTELERKTGEVISDITSRIIIPGSVGKTLVTSLAKTVGIPLAAALAKEGLLKLGKDEPTAQGGKMATMLILDLASARQGVGMGGSAKYISHLFKEAENSIPQGATTSGKQLATTLNTLAMDMKKGGSSPTTKTALLKIEELQDRIKNGKIEVSELPAARVKINDLISEMGGWSVELPKKLKRAAIHNLNKVKGAVVEAGAAYGKRSNPEFLKNWSAANEAAAVNYKANAFTKFIKENFGDKFLSTGAKTLFGLGSTGATIGAKALAPALLPAVGIPLAVGSGTYQGIKFLRKVIQSPVLAKYYARVIGSAAKENAPSLVQNMTLLDKKMYDEEQKEKELIERYSK